MLRGQLSHLTDTVWQTMMFSTELALMAIIPLTLHFVPSFRNTSTGLWTAALTGVSGVVLNRVNVGGLVHLGRGDVLYLPAWTEIAISLAVVSGAVLVFLFKVKKFKVWENPPENPEEKPTGAPIFHPLDLTWLGLQGHGTRTRYSLSFIVAASVGFMMLSGNLARSLGVPIHRLKGREDAIRYG